MDDADFVVHAASPFTFAIKDIQEDLIVPAVQSTARFLEAINDCSKVKKLVLASPFAAVVDPYTYVGSLAFILWLRDLAQY